MKWNTNVTYVCKIPRQSIRILSVSVRITDIRSICIRQTWSSRDLSLGLETSQDPFLQVLVSVLVLEPQSIGLGLGLGTSESWSWSWNPWVSVSVLVLEPQSLGLGLGLGTLKSRSRSWSWDLRPWRLSFRHSWSVKFFCPSVTSAPVERIFSHSGLLMRANRARMGDTTCCHSWSTCDATISCKFSCCCTVCDWLVCSCMTRNTWTLTWTC